MTQGSAGLPVEPPAAGSSGRRQRRDAADNRERLLDAAEQHFGEHGIDAPLQGVADRAGLGIATLYRHFPSHPDLVQAMYDRVIARFEHALEDAATKPTAWEGIVAFVDNNIKVIFEHPESIEVMRRQAKNDPTYRPGERDEAPLRDLVARAQAEGELRPDIDATDIITIPMALAGIRHLPEPQRGLMIARQRALVVAGMRATTPQLPHAPLGTEEFHLTMHD